MIATNIRDELTGTSEGYDVLVCGMLKRNIYMHQHLKFFKFVRGCNTAVPTLNINLIKYVKTLFLSYNR
jgi:hypothetical protein